MSQPSDLFGHLKEYEVQPPPEAFAILKSRLTADSEIHFPDELQGSLQKLQQQELAPPAFLYDSITAAIAAVPELAFLQSEEVNPPEETFNKIRTSLPKIRNEKKIAGLLKSFPLRIAAASLLLFLSAWGIYRLIVAPRKAPAAMALHTIKKTTPSPQPIAALADTINHDLSVSNEPDQVNTAYKNFFKNNQFRNGDDMYSLIDNDFIITFTSINSPELQAFFSKEENKEWRIRLDQYSYFNISERMVTMLKKMYQKKSNGAPTRKARKEKEKLEQWKKADEKMFDTLKGNNSLDVIDLAEFIFK